MYKGKVTISKLDVKIYLLGGRQQLCIHVFEKWNYGQGCEIDRSGKAISSIPASTRIDARQIENATVRSLNNADAARLF